MLCVNTCLNLHIDICITYSFSLQARLQTFNRGSPEGKVIPVWTKEKVIPGFQDDWHHLHYSVQPRFIHVYRSQEVTLFAEPYHQVCVCDITEEVDVVWISYLQKRFWVRQISLFVSYQFCNSSEKLKKREHWLNQTFLWTVPLRAFHHSICCI